MVLHCLLFADPLVQLAANINFHAPINWSWDIEHHRPIRLVETLILILH